MSHSTYIDRCGEQVFVPPFVANINNFFGFAVEADHQMLNENICDRFFNGPLKSKKRFTAFKYVFFIFSNIVQACSEDANYKDRGVFSYQEAAVWMLIADKESKRIRWFQPYIFVDDPYAMHAGREIYGFPKTLGSFHIPKGPNPPERLWVKTLVVKEKKADGKNAMLFEVGLPPGSSCTHCDPDDKTDFVSKILENLKVTGPEYFEQFGLERLFAQSAYDDLLQMRLPIMFLKQFRDGVNPMQANSVVVQEAEARITKFAGSRIYNDPQQPYEIAINDVISHPIRRDLGLAEGQLKINLAFWMSFEFSLGNCTLTT